MSGLRHPALLQSRLAVEHRVGQRGELPGEGAARSGARPYADTASATCIVPSAARFIAATARVCLRVLGGESP